jgi:putative endonuclease
MSYYVYMIEGTDSSLYTGITVNIRKRLDQHNGLQSGGARYTRKNRPYFLAHIEKYPTRSDALKREYAIKQLTHKEKMAIIRKTKKEDILAAI